jgi:hypothetical protein
MLADVATGPVGEILLLDRLNRTIEVYDSSGAFIRRIGREGAGPGEFSSPFAIDATKQYIVVLDSNPTKAVTLLDWSGRPIETAAGTTSDWVNIATRGPRTKLAAPFQGGPEDWSRRLSAVEDSQFVVHVRPSDTHIARNLSPSGVGWLVVFSRRLIAGDTIARVMVPDTRVNSMPVIDRQTGVQVARHPSERAEEIFAARPVFAGGAGWVAIGHGSDNKVVVKRGARDRALVLDWPSGTRAITVADQTAAVLREIEATNLVDRTAARNWNRLTEQERAAWIDRGVRLWPFAAFAPEVVAAYGRGVCLWLAGFDPEASLDATARHLLAVRIVPPYGAATFRLPRSELRLRHISESAIYASYMDDDGADRLVRLRFNELECE